MPLFILIWQIGHQSILLIAMSLFGKWWNCAGNVARWQLTGRRITDITGLLEICIYNFSFFYFWPCHIACRILVAWPEAWSPNHWTSREFPTFAVFIEKYCLFNKRGKEGKQKGRKEGGRERKTMHLTKSPLIGLPRWLRGKECVCQRRSLRWCSFDPWVGKIPWRRKWQPTPVFLPGKSHGQRSLGGYSPPGRKESDVSEWLSTCVWAS